MRGFIRRIPSLIGHTWFEWMFSNRLFWKFNIYFFVIQFSQVIINVSVWDPFMSSFRCGRKSCFRILTNVRNATVIWFCPFLFIIFLWFILVSKLQQSKKVINILSILKKKTIHNYINESTIGTIQAWTCFNHMEPLIKKHTNDFVEIYIPKNAHMVRLHLKGVHNLRHDPSKGAKYQLAFRGTMATPCMGHVPTLWVACRPLIVCMCSPPQIVNYALVIWSNESRVGSLTDCEKIIKVDGFRLSKHLTLNNRSMLKFVVLLRFMVVQENRYTLLGGRGGFSYCDGSFPCDLKSSLMIIKFRN